MVALSPVMKAREDWRVGDRQPRETQGRAPRKSKAAKKFRETVFSRFAGTLPLPLSSLRRMGLNPSARKQTRLQRFANWCIPRPPPSSGIFHDRGPRGQDFVRGVEVNATFRGIAKATLIREPL